MWNYPFFSDFVRVRPDGRSELTAVAEGKAPPQMDLRDRRFFRDVVLIPYPSPGRWSIGFLTSAPKRWDFDATVSADSERVFAAISADPSTWNWFPGITGGCYEGPEPHGVGTIREARMGPTVYRETMLAWDAPTRWVYRVDEMSVPLAHALVEELMILANEVVGALLAGRRREALYRVHERPDPQSIELLLAKLAALEVPTPPAPEQLSPAEAARLAGRISAKVTKYIERAGRGRDAFPALVLRSLKQARYDPRNLGHSGLASRAYCHFTSPIRRYPDLVVHRALLAELGLDDEPLPAELEELGDWTSARERDAAEVGYRAGELCLGRLLERRLFESGWDVAFAGEIVGAIGSGLFVRFDEVFEGFLPARRLAGDYFELDPLGIALVGRRSGRTYRLGDGVEVRVDRIEKPTGKIALFPA